MRHHSFVYSCVALGLSLVGGSGRAESPPRSCLIAQATFSQGITLDFAAAAGGNPNSCEFRIPEVLETSCGYGIDYLSIPGDGASFGLPLPFRDGAQRKANGEPMQLSIGGSKKKNDSGYAVAKRIFDGMIRAKVTIKGNSTERRSAKGLVSCTKTLEAGDESYACDFSGALYVTTVVGKPGIGHGGRMIEGCL